MENQRLAQQVHGLQHTARLTAAAGAQRSDTGKIQGHSDTNESFQGHSDTVGIQHTSDRSGIQGRIDAGGSLVIPQRAHVNHQEYVDAVDSTADIKHMACAVEALTKHVHALTMHIEEQHVLHQQQLDMVQSCNQALVSQQQQASLLQQQQQQDTSRRALQEVQQDTKHQRNTDHQTHYTITDNQEERTIYTDASVVWSKQRSTQGSTHEHTQQSRVLDTEVCNTLLCSMCTYTVCSMCIVCTYTAYTVHCLFVYSALCACGICIMSMQQGVTCCCSEAFRNMRIRTTSYNILL